MRAGLASAFAFGTVLPASRRDQSLDASTVSWLPVVGAVLGLVTAGTLWAGSWAFGAHSALTGLLAVTILLLVTRGLHLDGLADTADGLGCHGPPERALAVMREGSVGAFGVAAVVLAVVTQAAAYTAMPAGVHGLAAAVAALTAGRVAAVLACRRGVTAEPASRLASRVVGTQSPIVVVAWLILACGLAAFATPRPWQGPLVVVLALGVAGTLIDHCARRFGGVTGDVIGAAIELATTLTALGLVIGL